MKPVKVKHYSKGSKLGNVLMTRFRTGRTGLFQHKYSIGQVESPECICHAKSESPKHYIFDCFLYTAERQNLFSLVEHYIPKFSKLNKDSKFELLMTGLNSTDPDYYYLNIKISIAVQKFIIQTKRFVQPTIS